MISVILLGHVHAIHLMEGSASDVTQKSDVLKRFLETSFKQKYSNFLTDFVLCFG